MAIFHNKEGTAADNWKGGLHSLLHNDHDFHGFDEEEVKQSFEKVMELSSEKEELGEQPAPKFNVEERGNTKAQINIWEVISESLGLYKRNFGLFVKIAFIIFLISFLNNTFKVLDLPLKGTLLSPFYSVFLFAIIFPFLYYSIKFGMAFYISVSARFKGDEITVKSAFGLTAGRVWNYVGTSIKLFFILFIPSVWIMVPFLLVQGILKWIIIGLFIVPTVYLVSVYGFAPLMAALGDEDERYLKTSRRLVAGNTWKVMLLTLIISVGVFSPQLVYMYIFNGYRAVQPLTGYVIQSLCQLPLVLVTPLANSIYVTLFYKLKGQKVG